MMLISCKGEDRPLNMNARPQTDYTQPPCVAGASHLPGCTLPERCHRSRPWQLWEGVLIFITPHFKRSAWVLIRYQMRYPCPRNHHFLTDDILARSPHYPCPGCASTLTIDHGPPSLLPISLKCCSHPSSFPLSPALHCSGLCVAQLDSCPGPSWWHCAPASLLSC